MRISGFASIASLSYGPGSSRLPVGDRIGINVTPKLFAELVRTASSMPEVRGELVDAYKARISAGDYPSRDVMESLVHRMGPAWSKAANDDVSN